MRQVFGLYFGTTNSALARAHADRTVELGELRLRVRRFGRLLYFDEGENSTLVNKLRVVAGPEAIQSYLNAKTPGRLIQSTKSYLASRLFSQTQIFGDTYSLQRIDRHTAASPAPIRRSPIR